MSLGRRPGSNKADKAKALELRNQGKTNDQIAELLGVSPRTVTRYFTPEKKRNASRSITLNWFKMFKVKGLPMQLFILRYSNDPRWKQLWADQSAVDPAQCLKAIHIKREFESFLKRSEESHLVYADLNRNDEASAYDASNYDDDLWKGDESKLSLADFLQRRKAIIDEDDVGF